MTTAAWITLVLLVVMFVFLVWNKLPIWLVFIGAVTAAMTLQLASPAALLKGYSNTGVITVAALFGFPLTLIVGLVVLLLAPVVYGF